MAQPLILDQSNRDRAATQLIGTPPLQVFSLSAHHLKKLAIILELTGMASSSGLRACSLTLSLCHSSLRSPSVLSCAGLGPRERRGAERDSRALVPLL